MVRAAGQVQPAVLQDWPDPELLLVVAAVYACVVIFHQSAVNRVLAQLTERMTEFRVLDDIGSQ